MDITIQNSEISVVDSYWEKLRTLSKTARLYLANKLTDSVKEEEAIDHTKRIAKVKRVIKRRNVFTSLIFSFGKRQLKTVPIIVKRKSSKRTVKPNTKRPGVGIIIERKAAINM